MMTFTIPAIDAMAMECTKQMTDPMAVGWLADAIKCAFDHRKQAMTVDILKSLNVFITRTKPHVRTTPVSFANGTVLPATNIVERLHKLIVDGELLSPEEWLKEFLDIHPFNDGNGRVAFVLWNVYFGKGRWFDSPSDPAIERLVNYPNFYAKG